MLASIIMLTRFHHLLKTYIQIEGVLTAHVASALSSKGRRTTRRMQEVTKVLLSCVSLGTNNRRELYGRRGGAEEDVRRSNTE